VRQDRPGAHPFDEPAMKDYYLSQEPEGRRSHTHWRDDSALDAVKQILDLGEKLLRCPCKECNLCGSERDWLLSFIFSAISAHGASFLRGNVFAQLPQLALHFDDPAWARCVGFAETEVKDAATARMDSAPASSAPAHSVP
jgi:hypothetical protein